MDIRLRKDESVTVYCPYGGGVELTLTATESGMRVANINSRLRIKETRSEYVRKWYLSRDEEHGFDRT